MTAPRLPSVGFTDGATAVITGCPRVFVDGAWRSVTEAAALRKRVVITEKPRRVVLVERQRRELVEVQP